MTGLAGNYKLWWKCVVGYNRMNQSLSIVLMLIAVKIYLIKFDILTPQTNQPNSDQRPDTPMPECYYGGEYPSEICFNKYTA